MLQAGRSLFRFQTLMNIFFIDLILPAHCGLGVDSASNRNEYQESFSRVKVGLGVRLTPPYEYMSRLSRKCENLDVSQA
jgi:hypothetical protein